MARRKLSFIKILTVTIALLFLVSFVMILANQIYIIHSTKAHTFRQQHSILKQQNMQIHDELKNVQGYLSSFVYSSPELDTIARVRKDTEYYIAIYRQKAGFSAFLSSCPIIDGLAVYSVPSDEFILAIEDSDEAVTGAMLRETVRASAKDNALNDFCSSHWYPIELNNQSYLILCLRAGANYLFSWTRCSNILAKLRGGSDIEFRYLLYDSSVCYTEENTPLNDSPEIDFSNEDFGKILLDQDYLSLAIHADYLGEDGGLILLVPNVYLTSQLRFGYMLLVVAMILLICIAGSMTFILRRHLAKPINQLLLSIRSLQDGNFDTRLPDHSSYVEFQPINDAFNDMISQIRDLKIHVYEEQLKQQRIQSRFLRAQIMPHFFINCLNIIYHLAAQSRMEQVQKMSVNLSCHLRYTLSDRSLTTLKEELSEIDNYIVLSNYRYADAISLHVSVADTLMDTPILPMILVMQIENIVKHVVVAGELTQIYIESYSEEDGLLHLRIWDSGNGWDDENLRLLNSNEIMTQESGHHIGIQNIIQRMRLHYGEKFRIFFSNHDNAGAQIDYWFPLERIKEGKNNDCTDC